MQLTAKEYSLILQALAFFGGQLLEMSGPESERYLRTLEQIDSLLEKLKTIEIIAE